MTTSVESSTLLFTWVVSFDLEDDGIQEILVGDREHPIALFARKDGALVGVEGKSIGGKAEDLRFYVHSVTTFDATRDGVVDIVISVGKGDQLSTDLLVIPRRADGGLSQPFVVSLPVIAGAVELVRHDSHGTQVYISHQFGFSIMQLAADLSGDFNRDGHVNSLDLNLLCAAVHEIEPASVGKFDLDQSGAVGAADTDVWLSQFASTVNGDLNLDGAVDFADFLQLSANFGMENAAWTEGDLNCDGRVDFDDFLVLARWFA